MENILIRKQVIPSLDSLLNLYNDISWTAYTSNPNQLELALKNSLKVWTAWDGDLLVGLARVIGDGSTIIYIQDILVLKAYQRRGIGSHFITTILDEYEDIRQIILLTEDNLFYIVKFQNHYIGFARLGNRGAKIDWLEDLFIDEQFQNRGLGTQVINILENKVKQYSESLYLEVASRNLKAMKLYRELGFDCLNSITIRKDFQKENFEVIERQKISDFQFDIKKYNKLFRGQMVGQIPSRQAKKPLIKGFFMYSMIPPTG